jgi:hypothetical protein
MSPSGQRALTSAHAAVPLPWGLRLTPLLVVVLLPLDFDKRGSFLLSGLLFHYRRWTMSRMLLFLRA